MKQEGLVYSERSNYLRAFRAQCQTLTLAYLFLITGVGHLMFYLNSVEVN